MTRKYTSKKSSNKRIKTDWKSVTQKSDKSGFFSKLNFFKKSSEDQIHPSIQRNTSKITKEKLKKTSKPQQPSKSQEKPHKSLIILILGYLLKVLLLPFQMVLFPFVWLFKTTGSWLFIRERVIQIVFASLFFVIIFRFADLQIMSQEPDSAGVNSEIANLSSIIYARRGQIFMQDQSQNKNDIAMTSSDLQFQIFIDANQLKKQVEKGLVLQDAVAELSSRLNLTYSDTFENIKKEIDKEKPNASLVIATNVSQTQRQAVDYLKSSQLNKQFSYSNWLGVTQKQVRTYLQGTTLASTLGYTPPFQIASSEIFTRFKDCQDLVNSNIARGTNPGQYTVGSYGLEQKYCSQLGGLNGKKVSNSNTNTGEVEVQNGANIYLTLDYNIQREAERILDQAVKATTNENGGPRNGAIIVMEVKTGKLLGLASYPSYDPNDYQKYWLENPESFRNAATGVAYDVGSVMKPLTVAAALNTYQSGVIENGKLRGVPPDYKFIDYDSRGKAYEEVNGNIKYIQNSEARSYRAQGNIGLKETIRDSINTGIANVVEETGSKQLNEYFTNRFLLGSRTAVDLPGDDAGNITNFTKDINCQFCYANMGFGQGYTATPLQLARSFTSIANKGRIVEPYLIDKIEYGDGTIDDGTSTNSVIKRTQPRQVITENTASLVTGYMRAVVEDGFVGSEQSPAKVDGYYMAGKTGTAEVNRPYIVRDATGKIVFDESDQPILRPCDYSCNRKRGIYDHTFVGFGPVSNPEYLIIVKLSEPNPGRVKNFSSATVGSPFAQMMSFTLNYNRVTRDY